MSTTKSGAKHHKRGASKSAGRSSSTSHVSSASASASASAGTGTGTGAASTPSRVPPGEIPPVSFLFVVNEIVIDYDTPQTRHIGMPKDDWHNYLPPQRREQYAGEKQSEVLRFQAGRIERASSDLVRYYWMRRHLGEEGGILGQFVGQPAFYAQPYKRASVFSCNPLLPVIVAEDDVLVRPDATFHALHFLHARSVSQASYPFDYAPSVALPPAIAALGPPLKYVAGAAPTWVPSLVPSTYANPYRAGLSGGLGGELAIVLGLMAFHSARPSERGRCVDEVFLGKPSESSGLWKDYHWRTTSSPPGYPLSMQETPRGFLVHICFDPENPQGSTAQNLAVLEWQGPLVLG
ncbi:hypothetical protein E4U42_003774 [Claviceps africana]|uniref:Uncharacterized protein n=1 Tax=Claviceps africana TaxID=83212 RepID=A0A8K0JCB1_9HYPO|nr:hypothetical protein E4U42_003774 [Claviceps africana]